MLHYPAIKQDTGYISPTVTLEFGGRATGEPHQVLPVTCEIEGHVDGVMFPEGTARDALASDYAKMLEDQVMVGDALPFDELMQACADVAARANAATRAYHLLAGLCASKPSTG